MHVLPATFFFNRGSLCSMLIAKIDLHVACCMSAFMKGSRYRTGARKETIALVSLSLFMQSVQVQWRPPLKKPWFRARSPARLSILTCSSRFYIGLVCFSKLPRIFSFFSEVPQGSTTKHGSMLASPSIDKKLGVDFRVSMYNIYIIHHRITHMTETHAVQFRML